MELYDDAVLQLTEDIYNDAVSMNPVLFENKWSFMGGSISGLRRSILNKVDGAENNKPAAKEVRKHGSVKGYDVDLNDIQKSAYRILRQIADVTGIDIVLFKSQKDAQGNLRGGIVEGIDMRNAQGAFSWHNDKIYIDVNAGVLTEAEMGDTAKYALLRTFSHEFTHFIEKHNPVEYASFQELVFETMRKNGHDPEAMIEGYMQRDKSLDRDKASREVVAEGMTDILPESRFVQELAEEHRNLFQTLLDKLRAFVESIRDHFANIGYNPAEEAQALKEQADGVMKYADDIVKMFDKIAVQAVENYQQTQNAQKNTAQTDGGVQMQIRQSFYSEFDAWDGKHPNVSFTVGTTSDALKSIGMKDQAIKMHSGMMISKMNKHSEITRDIFRQVPDLLEHPVIVQFSDAIDPKTGKPKYDDSITVLGELYAKVKNNGKEESKPVLVALNLLPKKKKTSVVLNIAVVKSAYTKDALQQYIDENSILYIDPDKKRTNSWLSRTGLSLPVGENRYGSIRKISYADGKVKVQNAKNMTDMQRALLKAGVVDEFGNSKQRRNSTLTNRDILAGLPESATQNENERYYLQKYREQLSKVREQERIQAELTQEIEQLEPGQTEKLQQLKTELTKTRNRLNILGRNLKQTEAVKPLDAILQREAPKILEQLRKEYGTIPKGENAVRDDSLPVSTDGKNKVSRTARTVKGAAVTPDEFAGLIDTEVAKGELTYLPISNDETSAEAVRASACTTFSRRYRITWTSIPTALLPCRRL